MDEKDLAFLRRMQTRLKCKGEKCGQHFTFEISEHNFKHLEEKKQTYIGKCGKCHTVLKIKGTSLRNFSRIMGEPTIVKVTVGFDKLFTEE